jgi:hypothetical protein
MFESLFPEPRRQAWYIRPLQVLCNLFLAWMLLSTANIVFLLPFPYRDRLPYFLLIAALGPIAAFISGALFRYRREQRVAIYSILKTPPVLVWGFISIGLAVVFGALYKGLSESMEHLLWVARTFLLSEQSSRMPLANRQGDKLSVERNEHFPTQPTALCDYAVGELRRSCILRNRRTPSSFLLGRRAGRTARR